MKTTLLIVCSILLVQLSSAQFSRSYFPFENITVNNRNLTIFNEGKYYLITPSNIDVSGELILKIGEIDNLGNLGHVDKIQLNLGYNGTRSKVASAVFNADGSLSIAVFTQYTGKNKLTLIRVLGEVVQQQYDMPSSELYIDNIPVVKIKDNSFVSYLTTNSGFFKRLEIPTENFENFSEEIVADHNYSASTAHFQYLDFEIDGDAEYIFTKNKGLIQRISFNNYIIVPFQDLEVNYYCKIRKLNEQLYVFFKKQVFKFDLNLNFLEEVIFDENLLYQNTFLGFTDVIQIEDKFIYVSKTQNNYEYVFYCLDSNLAILDFKSIHKFWSVFNIEYLNNRIVINGLDADMINFSDLNHQFNLQGKPSFLGVFDDFQNISDSEDYFKKIKSNNLECSIAVGEEFFKGKNMIGTFKYSVNLTEKETSLLYCASTKLIGKNNSGDFVGMNNSSSLYDGWSFPGPYTDSVYVTDSLFSKYSRPYYVTRQMIIEHLQNIQWGSPNYIVPHGIREWPAHGNVSHGQSENLAKFIDVNSNGIYEPYFGDYPAIYGDECVLTIQNKHDQATGMKLEWMNYIYFFNCEENKEPVVFVNSVYTNKGVNINETYFSNLSYYDVGNYTDDYVGTHIELGMTYGYNGDNFDEDNSGLLGFEYVIPAIGMQLLKGAKMDNDGIDNEIGVTNNASINGLGFEDGVVDNEYYTLESSYEMSNMMTYEPTTDLEFFYAAQGIRTNGSSQLANGVPVNYSFFGNSDPQFYASGGVDHGNDDFEVGSNMMPGDRRILGSSGPFTFEEGESRSFLQAYLVAVDTVTPLPMNSVNKLIEYATALKQEFAINETECGNNFDEIQDDLGIVKPVENDILIYPNPFKESITITGLDEVGGEIFIYNMEGKLLTSKEIKFHEETIDLSELKAGIYLIHVQNGGKNSLSKMVKL
jgi:hypothetical protein